MQGGLEGKPDRAEHRPRRPSRSPTGRQPSPTIVRRRCQPEILAQRPESEDDELSCWPGGSTHRRLAAALRWLVLRPRAFVQLEPRTIREASFHSNNSPALRKQRERGRVALPR